MMRNADPEETIGDKFVMSHDKYSEPDSPPSLQALSADLTPASGPAISSA